MWWNNGVGFGMGWGMWLVMLLGTIGFWLLVAYIVRLVVHGPPHKPDGPVDEPTAMQILDRRLARGEIDADEYQQAKRLLGQGR